MGLYKSKKDLIIYFSRRCSDARLRRAGRKKITTETQRMHKVHKAKLFFKKQFKSPTIV